MGGVLCTTGAVGEPPTTANGLLSTMTGGIDAARARVGFAVTGTAGNSGRPRIEGTRGGEPAVGVCPRGLGLAQELS